MRVTCEGNRTFYTGRTVEFGEKRIVLLPTVKYIETDTDVTNDERFTKDPL